jgi:hypothetical protein
MEVSNIHKNNIGATGAGGVNTQGYFNDNPENSHNHLTLDETSK